LDFVKDACDLPIGVLLVGAVLDEIGVFAEGVID